MVVPPPSPSPPRSALDHDAVARKIADPRAWEKFLFDTPCVKSSYLWGVGLGALMFAHKARLYPGKLRHSFNAAFLTFLFTSTTSFVICSTEVNRKYDALRKAFQVQGIKEAPTSKQQPRP